jgi:hypothetical protein
MEDSNLLYEEDLKMIICTTCGFGLSNKPKLLEYHIRGYHQIKGSQLRQTIEEVTALDLVDIDLIEAPSSRILPIHGLNTIPGVQCSYPDCEARPYRRRRDLATHLTKTHTVEAKKVQTFIKNIHMQTLFTKPRPSYFSVTYSTDTASTETATAGGAEGEASQESLAIEAMFNSSAPPGPEELQIPDASSELSMNPWIGETGFQAHLGGLKSRGLRDLISFVLEFSGSLEPKVAWRPLVSEPLSALALFPHSFAEVFTPPSLFSIPLRRANTFVLFNYIRCIRLR